MARAGHKTAQKKGGRGDDGRLVVASNRRARHDYHLSETWEAGIVLSGTEVKSLRAGRASLLDGFVSVDRGEAWLEAVHIPEYTQGTWTNHPVRRRRKLLLHKLEIEKMSAEIREGGMTVVPLQLYFTGGRAKVEIALGQGKKNWDKRQTLRERQDTRESQRAMSLRVRQGE